MTITLTSTKIAPAMRVSFSMVSSRWAFSGRARLLGGAMLVTGGAMLVTRVVTLALGTLEPSSVMLSAVGGNSGYLLTGVTFEEKVEGRVRHRATRTCSDTGSSGLYTDPRCAPTIYEELMTGHDRQRTHRPNGVAKSPNPQPSRRRLSAIASQRHLWRSPAYAFAPYTAPAPLRRMPVSRAL